MSDRPAQCSRCSGGRLAVLRVVRGGSFINNDINARCSYRNRNNPENRNNNVGFRVVVLTFLEKPELLGGAQALPGRGEKWRSLLPAAP